MPPLALETLRGTSATLSDYFGSVVVVHFFATWCEPCRTELAALDELRRRLGPKGLVILTVDVGEPESRVRRFFEANPTGLTVLLDPDKRAMKAWEVDVLPTSFVLARGGCPRWLVVGEHDWTSPATIETLQTELVRASVQTCNLEGNKP